MKKMKIAFKVLVVGVLLQSAPALAGKTNMQPSVMKMDKGLAAKIAKITCKSAVKKNEPGYHDLKATATAKEDKVYAIHIEMTTPTALAVDYDAKLDFTGHFMMFDDESGKHILRVHELDDHVGNVIVLEGMTSEEYGPMTCEFKYHPKSRKPAKPETMDHSGH